MYITYSRGPPPAPILWSIFSHPPRCTLFSRGQTTDFFRGKSDSSQPLFAKTANLPEPRLPGSMCSNNLSPTEPGIQYHGQQQKDLCGTSARAGVDRHDNNVQWTGLCNCPRQEVVLAPFYTRTERAEPSIIL